MASLWRLTRAVIVILTLGIGGIRLIGNMQPRHFAILFTNPDGTPCQRPCLFGVRPGETSYKRAIVLLAAHPFTQSFEPDIRLGVFTGQGLSVIVFEDDNDQVSRIDLVRTSDSVEIPWASLGEAVAVLGAPNFVGVNAETYYPLTRSYYVADSMVLCHRGSTQSDTISVDQRFNCLFVFAHPLKTLSDSYLAPWRGFASLSHYQDHIIAHPQ